MNNVLKSIFKAVSTANPAAGFLNYVFRGVPVEELQTKSIIILGAGSLGSELCSALKNHGVTPSFFCDNDTSRSGEIFCDLPILSFAELKLLHKESLIVIGTRTYHAQAVRQLIDNGFCGDNIFCKELNTQTDLVYLYAMRCTQDVLTSMRSNADSRLRSILDGQGEQIQAAYDLFADQKSRDLFKAKLAFLVSGGNMELFGQFILNFSEPLLRFGVSSPSAPAEDYFYFNSDVFCLDQDEVYVDVGAFDGDSVRCFLEACRTGDLRYGHIHAIEPDPVSFEALKECTGRYANVTLYRTGLWSSSRELRFLSSSCAIHEEAGVVSEAGDIIIQATSLDDLMAGKKVTLIKMDLGNNVLLEVIKGSAGIIAGNCPKLVIGAYHVIESIYEVPLLVHSICPDYRMYLRHNTYHLCDTDLYATV
jgi:FkbM family methyltransferase